MLCLLWLDWNWRVCCVAKILKVGHGNWIDLLVSETWWNFQDTRTYFLLLWGESTATSYHKPESKKSTYLPRKRVVTTIWMSLDLDLEMSLSHGNMWIPLVVHALIYSFMVDTLKIKWKKIKWNRTCFFHIVWLMLYLWILFHRNAKWSSQISVRFQVLVILKYRQTNLCKYLALTLAYLPPPVTTT